MTIVLVTGDRHWTDRELIYNELFPYTKDETYVIQGGASGADTIAQHICQDLTIPCLTYEANWLVYGRAVGPIRNKRILVEGKPNIVLAFHDDLQKSKGTRNMVNLAIKAGIPVKLVSHDIGV